MDAVIFHFSSDKSRAFLPKGFDEGGGGIKKKKIQKNPKVFKQRTEVVSVSVLFHPHSVRLHFIAISRLKARQ